MTPVLTAAAARAADAAVIDGLGLPGIALMEAASAGVAQVIVERCADLAARGVAILCGPGNNGGDGYGVARRLAARGLPVRTVSLAPRSTGDAATMRAVAGAAGVPDTDTLTLDDAGLVIDALFGTGLARPLDGRAAAWVQAVVAWGGPVVAVDLPSGLCADTGAVLGACAPAVHTVALGALKQGMLTGEGPGRCGRVDVVDLGFALRSPKAALVTREAVEAAWPQRAHDAHKTRSGHLLVIAGSAAMAGAAVLAVRGALAAGAGLVTLVAPDGARSRLAALPPEAMVVEGGAGARWDGRLPPLSRFDAVIVGPGLGGGAQLDAAMSAGLAALHQAFAGAVVVDADALDAIRGAGAGPRVRTPHPGEAARLLGVGVDRVTADRFGAARALASDGVITLLKGPHTLVADPAGRVAVNPTGGPALATGGSGDVLAGVVGALCARGLTADTASWAGAWVHGAAGDALAARRPGGWTASDIAAEVARVGGAWG